MAFPSLKSRLLLTSLWLGALSATTLTPARAQVSLTSNRTTETFDSLGASATASLPSGFRVDKNTSIATLGTFAAAGTATEQVDGANLASNATNGIYNFGAGTTDTGPDRAVGFLSSGTATKSGNLYVQLRNDTGEGVSQIPLTYHVEKYRNGSNSAGYRIQLFYSTDGGSTFTSAGNSFLTSFAADASSNGATPAPLSSTPVSGTLTLPTALAPAASVVLAWNYSVASGTTTTNAQALAIDDFSFSAIKTDPTPNSTPIPTGPSSSAIISEYRLSGPGSGANSDLDEFVEIFNNTNGPLDLTGWSVAAGGLTIPILSGRTIPAKGHLLLTNSGGYSLDGYGGTDAAKGDLTYTGDITLGSTLTLRNASGTTVDEVTSVGLTPTTATSQYSFARRLSLDTGLASSNASDFNLVDVGATTFGPDSVNDTSNGKVRLGSPGPENLSSPLNRSVLYTNLSQDASQNTVRNASDTSVAPLGTLSLRRTVTNNTGTTLTKVRFRLINTTSGTPTGASASSLADVRVVDGTANFVVGGVTVMPITVEKVAGATTGSLNSTFTLPLPQGGLTNGSAVSIDFKLGVFKTGSYRLAFLFEALVLDGPAVPNRPDDDNMLLGNPSGATVLNADQSNKENLLVEHNAESIGYQKSLGGPRWVSWHLGSNDLGTADRGDFRSDPLLPSDCRITSGDYTGSDFDRGHMCPSGDRTATDALNDETFFMSNILPQTQALNQRVWLTLEEFCRNQVKNQGKECYIMSGGIGSSGRIAGGKVNVPASCWKVAVILPKGSNDLSRINNSTQVIAVIMPNTTTITGNYTNFTTTVDAIESMTGLDLLSNLPDSIENALEARASN